MIDLWKAPLPKVVDKTDEAWSKYIRLRDSTIDHEGNWNGNCITCGKLILVLDSDGHWKSSAQCGHFITRENMATRFIDENTHLQCEYCNTVMDKREMVELYEDALTERYGSQVITILKDLKNKHGLVKYGRPQIIDAYDYARKGLSDILGT